MQLDITNIDKIVFEVKAMESLLPELRHIIHQWRMGIRTPALRFLSQKARLEMLERLAEPNNLEVLEKYLNETVVILPNDFHVAKNIETTIDGLEETVRAMRWFSRNVSISRKGDTVYLSYWK